jgi:protein O-mannosyl-transferase
MHNNSMNATSTRTTFLVCFILAILVTGVFQQVFSSEFVNFDDPIYVTENDHIQQGLTLKTAQWAFATHLHGHYHPLTWLSHAADFVFFGLDPAGHHLSSFLIHLINTLLLFITLRKLTGEMWPSAFAAALFGVHPLHVEPVAWVADRKDLLCGFFWILSLWVYAKAVEKKSLWFALLLMLTYFLGLLSKTMMITLPLVLLLLDYWPLRRFSFSNRSDIPSSSWFKIVLEKSGLFVVAVFFVLISTNAMQDLHVASKSLAPNWQADFLLFYRHYLEKFFWPSRLTVLYPYNETPEVIRLVLAALFLTGISAMIILFRKRLPFLLMGWLWFIVTLLPVAGLVHSGPHRVTDRYTYIPLIGLIIALTWTAAMASRCSKGRTRIAIAAAGTLLLVLSFLSYNQAGRWQSSVSLFTHAVSIYPNNWVAHNNLGDALDRNGQKNKAIEHYLSALQIRPQYANAHYNMGNTLSSMGRQGEALQHFLAALDIYPEFAEAHANAGILLVRTKRYLEAREYFEKALAINPEYEDARKNLDALSSLTRELEKRITALQNQAKVLPQDAGLQNTLGLLYREGGDVTKSMHSFREALRINPAFAGAHNNLGILFAEGGNYEEAAIHFQRAVDLDPVFSGARDNLERINALLQQQHPEK